MREILKLIHFQIFSAMSPAEFDKAVFVYNINKK